MRPTSEATHWTLRRNAGGFRSPTSRRGDDWNSPGCATGVQPIKSFQQQMYIARDAVGRQGHALGDTESSRAWFEGRHVECWLAFACAILFSDDAGTLKRIHEVNDVGMKGRGAT